MIYIFRIGMNRIFKILWKIIVLALQLNTLQENICKKEKQLKTLQMSTKQQI